MNKKFAKFLGVGLALVLALSLSLVTAVPVAATDPVGLNLISVGVDSSAEWVDAETMAPQAPCTGAYSLKLYALEGNAGGAGVYIPVNVAIEDIDSLSFARLGTIGDKDAKVNLLIDADNDGDLDFTEIEALEYHRTGIPSLGEDALLFLNPQNAPDGLIADDDWTTVDVYNTYKYFGKDKTGYIGWEANAFLGDAGGVQEVGSGVIDPADEVLGIIVLLGAGSEVADQTVYIDDIEINGITYDLEPTIADSGTFTVTGGTYTTTVVDVENGTIEANLPGAWVDTVVLGDFTATGTGDFYLAGEYSDWGTTATIDVSGTLEVGQITMSGTAAWVSGNDITTDLVTGIEGTITIDSEGVLTATLTGTAEVPGVGSWPCTLNIICSLITEGPVSVETYVPTFPTLDLTVPSGIIATAPFPVSSTSANPTDGKDYTNVRFNITLSSPEGVSITDRADVFTINTATPWPGVTPEEAGASISGTFGWDGTNWVGYWGPTEGFPMAPGDEETAEFTVEMAGTAPVGSYEVTVELVDFTPDPDQSLALATGSFTLSPLIGIDLSTTFIDFGQVLPGMASAPRLLVITNSGTIGVIVDAWTESDFYNQALTIDDLGLGSWSPSIVKGETHDASLVVTVPSEWEVGTQTGIIIFWVEAQ